MNRTCIDCGSTEKVFNNRCGACWERLKGERQVLTYSYFAQTRDEATQEAESQLEYWNDLVRRANMPKAFLIKGEWREDLGVYESMTPEGKRAVVDAWSAYYRKEAKYPVRFQNFNACKGWRDYWREQGVLSDLLAQMEREFRTAMKNAFSVADAGRPRKREDLIFRDTLHFGGGEFQKQGGRSLAFFERNGYMSEAGPGQVEFKMHGRTFMVRYHRPLPPASPIKNIHVSIDSETGDGVINFQTDLPRLQFKGGLTAIGDIGWRKLNGGEDGNFLHVLILETGEEIVYKRPLAVRVSNFDRGAGYISASGLAELDEKISYAKDNKMWEALKALSRRKAEQRQRLSQSNRRFVENVAADLWKRGVRVLFLEALDIKGMISNEERRKGKKGKTRTQAEKNLDASQKNRQLFMPPGLLMMRLKQIFERGDGQESGRVHEIENYRGTSSFCVIHAEEVTAETKGRKIVEYDCGCRRDRETNAVHSLAIRAVDEFTQIYPDLKRLVDLRKTGLVEKEQHEVKEQVVEAVA
jgi:hypothetical protein